MPKKARSVAMPDVVLCRRQGVSLVGQLCSALRRQIVQGELRPGERLPSTRTLAKHLRVSRNTVLDTFEKLAAEGYVRGRIGSGTRVCRALPSTYLSELPRSGSGSSKDFRHALRVARFPAEHAAVLDADNNAIYLFISA